MSYVIKLKRWEMSDGLVVTDDATLGSASGSPIWALPNAPYRPLHAPPCHACS